MIARVYESNLWSVVEKNGLADLSQFHRPDLFDEVPLFARAAEIEFLSGAKAEHQSQILLEFSLKFLRSLISYEPHETRFLAAITVWQSEKNEAIVPHLLVCTVPDHELYQTLRLTKVRSAFGKRAVNLLKKLDLDEEYEIFEDLGTDPGLTRVFIGPALAPYPWFVTLHNLCSPLGFSK